MWGKGGGPFYRKGLLPSPTPPSLLSQRLLTGEEATQREFFQSEVFKGRAKQVPFPVALETVNP